MSKQRVQLFQKVIYDGPTDKESFESFRQLCFAGNDSLLVDDIRHSRLYPNEQITNHKVNSVYAVSAGR